MTVEDLVKALSTGVNQKSTVKIYVPGRGHYNLSNDIVINKAVQGFSKDYIVLKVE